MIMNALHALHLGTIPRNTLICLQTQRNLAHSVLYEARILIRMLGHILLVRTLQQAIQRRAGRSLCHLHQLLEPHHLLRFNLQLRIGTLIMRTIAADFLRAGAQRLHRHNCRNRPFKLLALLRLIHAVNIHRRSHAADRRSLRNKIRELQLDKGLLCLQMLLKLVENLLHVAQTYRAKRAQAFHKTAHMRTAHIMRQINSQRHLRHAVLRAMLSIAQLNRPAQILNAHML